MKKLGVLLIRGSGDTGFKRQEKFIKRLNKKLKKISVNPDDIACKIVDWYAPLQEQQEKLLQRMKDDPDLKLKSNLIRKLLLSNIADLITYGGKPNRDSEAFKRIHQLVYQSIKELKTELPEDAPLVILASSMGTEVMNDYFTERQKKLPDDPYADTPFERFESLVGLFTFGNNIPIFAASFNIDELKPIQFPFPGLSDKFKEIAVWENYYDKNDALGYPIKFMNSHYKQANATDIQISVGNPISAWNILSHFGYWTSAKVEKRISVYLKEVLNKVDG